MCAIHALKCDLPFDQVHWEDVKYGPIFRDPTFTNLDIDNLTENQLEAVRIAVSVQEGDWYSLNAERARNICVHISRYLELKRQL